MTVATVPLGELFPGHASGYWGKDPGTLDQDVRVVRNGDVLSSGSIRWDELPMRGFRRAEVAKSAIAPGDILLTTSGECARVGYVDRVSEATCASNFVRRLRVQEGRANSRYLFHLMNSERFRAMCAPFIRGTTLQNLSVGPAFGSVRLPLPDIDEQRRIAALLDVADALRAKRRDALAKLDTLTQAMFIEMFWDEGFSVSIGQMLADGVLELHKDGNHGSLYPRAYEFGEEGVPFLSAKCISEQGQLLPSEIQYLDEEKARTLRVGWISQGDVLLAHNASVGKTLLYRGECGEALIGTSLTAFRPNAEALDSRYLLGALRAHDFQQQLFSNMAQTTRNQVPITAQRRLSIPLPPLHLQQQFAAALERIGRQRSRQRDHLDEVDTLFESLQQSAFRGEL